MADLCASALVADGHFLSSAGIIKVLQENVGVNDVVHVTTFGDTCSALFQDKTYSFVTIELTLPGLDGLDGVRFLRKEFPKLRVVLVSDDMSKAAVMGALLAGVHGYVLKDMDAAAMVGAFNDVIGGKISVPVALTDEPVDEMQVARNGSGAHAADPYARLTARQRDVVEHMCNGCSNKEIGRALQITESTVKVHLAAAFRQLGVHNRVGVLAALQGRLRS